MIRLPDSLERNYPYLVLAASMGMIFFASGVGQLLVVCLKAMAEEFGWPRSVPSLAFGLFLIGSGVGSILVGYWMDRRGLAKPALVAAVTIGGGSVAVAFVDNEWQLYLVFGVVLGLAGRSAVYSPMITNAMHWFNTRRGMAIGIVSAAEPLSGAVWPPIINFLQETIGWRYTFVAFGLLAWAVMLPLSLVFRRLPPDQPLGPVARKGGQVAPPEIKTFSQANIQLILCVAVVFCCMPMAMPLVHIVSHVSDICGVPARGAEMLSLTLFAGFISRALLLGRLTERFGALVTLFIFSSIQIVGLLLMAYVSEIAALYIISIIFGVGYAGVLPCYPVIVREFLPAHQAGQRSATVIVFGAVGMAVGGWLAGHIFDVTGGYAAAFLVGAGANLLNLAIVAMLIRQNLRGCLAPVPL